MREQGIVACLTKPIYFEQLRSCIITAFEDLSGSEPKAMPHDLSRPYAHSACRCRILVAEDNPVNQKVAAGMLEKLGCRVDVVPNGMEALDASARIPYDLILMDCQMPDMDGIEATRAIRAREAGFGAGHRALGTGEDQSNAQCPMPNACPRVPIIAMTANAMQGHQDQCLIAGMDDYLLKPVSQEALRLIVCRWGPALITTAHLSPIPIDHNPAPTPRCQLQVFDQCAALARLEGNRMLLAELATIFLGHASDMLTKLEQAAERRDNVELEHAAHSLRGAATNLCALRVAGAAHRLEQIAQEGAMERLENGVTDLQRELAELRSALAEFGREARPCAS